jgi:hypothetical protein
LPLLEVCEGRRSTTAQVAVEPSVVKYLPELPVCAGRASTVAQETTEPFVVKNSPLFPVCEGTRALIAFAAVVAPVPPCAIARAVVSSRDPALSGANPIVPSEKFTFVVGFSVG